MGLRLIMDLETGSRQNHLRVRLVCLYATICWFRGSSNTPIWVFVLFSSSDFYRSSHEGQFWHWCIKVWGLLWCLSVVIGGGFDWIHCYDVSLLLYVFEDKNDGDDGGEWCHDRTRWWTELGRVLKLGFDRLWNTNDWCFEVAWFELGYRFIYLER